MTDNTTRLSVLSLNINGLSNEKKRKNLFEKIQNKNIDIVLLQETHSTKENIKKWEKEWDGKSFWHSGEIHKSTGVAILIKQNLNIEILTVTKDDEGRVLSLIFSFEKQNFQIINIYGPTKNSKKRNFYKSLNKYITLNENIILGGDFNMVEDPLLDRYGGNPNTTHTLGINHLTKIKQKYNLTDIWRKENPDKRLFTYHNKNQQIHSRIDRIYLLQNQKIQNTSIIPNNLSDHDAITVSLNIKKTNQQGQGYWKLNTSILQQQSFQKLFKQFWNDWKKQQKNYQSLNKWWEAGKIYFKILAIQFSTFQNQKRRKNLQNLTQKILKEKIKTNQDQNKIQNWQNQIDDIENYQKMGTVIRSKEKLIVNEEIPNKFFYQTEKVKQTKKQIITLQNEQNKTLTNNHEILKECHNYYQQLYKKQNNCKLTQQQL